MAKKLQRSVKKQAAPQSGGSRSSGSKSSKQSGSGEKGGGGGFRGRVSAQAVTDFTIQMATLSEAGIPIVRSLQILEGQARPGPFKNVLTELVDDVSGGTPLSEAMEKHPRVFDSLYSSMVRAGETGGVLDEVLNRTAAFRERAAEIRAQVTGATIYPVVVLFVAITVVALVIALVIPKFREVFLSFSIEMPAATQVLLDISDFAVNYWYVCFGVPIALAIGHVLLMKRNDGYRYRIHALTLKVPYLGPVLARSTTAQFARTFGTLVQAGVPHLDALAITRDTASNEVLYTSVDEIRRVVREGETISRPMGDSPIFDDLVTNMVEVGEQTGELDRMLLRVADAYESEVGRKIDSLFKILEPLLLIVMAIFVGFIVVALFLPLLKIMSSVGSL